MLIDFTVENFRSIKEPVTLSMLAQSRSGGRSSTRSGIKPDEEIAKPYDIGNRGIEVLPAVGIFGANASGKSNLFKALDLLLGYMYFGTGESHGFFRNFAPFALDESYKSSPTRFELRVAASLKIFTYSLTINGERILLERLKYAPDFSSRSRLLFERVWNGSAYKWRNGSDFSGPYNLLENNLAPVEPFTSLLVSRFEIPVMQGFSDWIRFRWLGAGYHLEEPFDDLTLGLSYETKTQEEVSEVIRRLDTGISNILIQKSKLINAERGDNEYEAYAIHDTPHGPVPFHFREESAGTQRLLGLVIKILYSLDLGALLLYDELGSNIHSSIVRQIIKLFQDKKTNQEHAQLIFTSHDYTLMHGNLLRRDQIWFTQKKPDGSTELYPLTDFHPRNDLAIDKAYIDGRFGAVPILPEEEDLLPTEELVG